MLNTHLDKSSSDSSSEEDETSESSSSDDSEHKYDGHDNMPSVELETMLLRKGIEIALPAGATKQLPSVLYVNLKT